MAFFNKIRKKEGQIPAIQKLAIENYQEEIIYCPLKGRLISLDNIDDPAFGKGAMGPGFAVDPEEGVLYAPVNGKITALFPTKHALGIVCDNGAEILLHIGIDTVELNGEGFEALITNGSRVTAGQPLITFDIEKIKARNLLAVTMVILSDMGRFKKVEIIEETAVILGQAVAKLS